MMPRLQCWFGNSAPPPTCPRMGDCTDWPHRLPVAHPWKVLHVSDGHRCSMPTCTGNRTQPAPPVMAVRAAFAGVAPSETIVAMPLTRCRRRDAVQAVVRRMGGHRVGNPRRASVAGLARTTRGGGPRLKSWTGTSLTPRIDWCHVLSLRMYPGESPNPGRPVGAAWEVRRDPYGFRKTRCPGGSTIGGGWEPAGTGRMGMRPRGSVPRNCPACAPNSTRNSPVRICP